MGDRRNDRSQESTPGLPSLPSLGACWVGRAEWAGEKQILGGERWSRAGEDSLDQEH